MTTDITTITPSELPTLKYTLWNEVEQTWGTPVAYAQAREAYAHDPELQAAAILNDGTATPPAPFAEILKRVQGQQPKDLSLIQRTAQAAAKRAQTAPSPGAQAALSTNPEILRHLQNIEAYLQLINRKEQHEQTNPMLEARLTHYLRLRIILTYAILYLSSIASFIVGLSEKLPVCTISGIVVLLATGCLQFFLTREE